MSLWKKGNVRTHMV